MADFGDEASRRLVSLNGPADHSAPLRGIVICCTSVPEEKRTQISEWAKQMGAVHSYDLTPDVTHLIIGATDSPKYQYVAKERNDVQPMTIEWIEAIRDLWINDQEIDLEALERHHMRPVFHGLKFSMTGCEDPAERLEVSELVKAKGGKYEGDLTKTITHLICFRTEGAKYKAAKSWKLKIISIEWVRDSAERGLLLDEKLYDPLTPITQRGEGAWDRTKPGRTSLGKRSREGSIASMEGGKRKLRRTASTKLNSQHQDMWGEIVGAGSTAQVSRSGVWEPENTDSPILNPLKAAACYGPPRANNVTTQATTQEPPRPKDLFSGCRFYLHGFPQNKTEVLHGHLVAKDATIAHSVEELVIPPDLENVTHLFRVVPHDLPVADFPELPRAFVPVETVTHWWVERCLHHKKFMDPSAHVVGRPFPRFPIPEFTSSKTIISSSGFGGIDLLHLTRAIQLIGANYSEDFTPNTWGLVTKSLTGMRKDKLDHAAEWKIPIMSADWLWESISAGKALPTSKFTLRSNGALSRRADSLPSIVAQQESAAPRSERPKSDLSKTTSGSTTKSRPLNPSGMDNAFDERPVPDILKPKISTSDEPVKPEVNTQAEPGSRSTSFALYNPSVEIEPSQDASFKTKPLSERSQNIVSPSRTVSTVPALSDGPYTRSREPVINETVLNDLLAKTKATPAPQDPAEPKPKRKIFGRIASNLSTTSSVDSTASHGCPVQYPPDTRSANERIEELVNGDRKGLNAVANADETQPSSTQLQYNDPESEVANHVMLAQMRGEKVDIEAIRRKGLERAVTISDGAPVQKVTRKKGRQSAGTK